CGMATDENIHPQRLPGAERGGVMYANAAVNLIMQAKFAVRNVSPARNLHAVHPEIRVRHTRLAHVLGIALRQRDECTTVVRPALELRKLADRGLVFEDRALAHASRLHPPSRERRGGISQW